MAISYKVKYTLVICPSFGRQDDAPPLPHSKDIHIQIPRTCEYVTLSGKRGLGRKLEAVIKLRILIEIRRLSMWAHCNYKGGKDRVTEGDVTTEAEVRMMQDHWLRKMVGF